MTLEQYIELIKDFARQDPDLLHVDKVSEAVFAVSYEEAVSVLAEISNRMVLMIPPYDKHVHHNQAMGNIWVKNGLVIALQHVEAEDYPERIKIQSKAEQVLDRLYAYLYAKRNTPELYGFDPTSWEADGIGPVGSSHYGYYAELSIKDGVMF